MVLIVAPAAGVAAAGAGIGLGHGLAHLGLIYSTTALYAGFWGLGALWVASFKKFGGPLIDNGGGYPPPYDYGGYGYGDNYGGGYDSKGYGGGGYGGGYAPSYSDSYHPPKSSKGKGGHGDSYSSKGKSGHDHGYSSKGKGGHDHDISSKGKGGGGHSYSPPKSKGGYSDNHVYTSTAHKGFGPLKGDSIHVKGHHYGDCHDRACDHHRRRRYRRNVEDPFNLQQGTATFRRQYDRPVEAITRQKRVLFSRLDNPKLWVSNTEPEEERLLHAIRERDTDNCGLRLVCELAAIRNRPLTREEWEILRFVRDGDALFDAMYPGQGVTANSEALRDYKEAAHYGQKGGACAQLFRMCRVGAADIMETIVEIRQEQRLYL